MNGTANADTIDLSGISLTTSSLALLTGAGVDTVTANAGGGTFTLGAGADIFTAGAGADVILIGDTDSGITLATADTITGFTSGTDDLNLGFAGGSTGSPADTLVIANAAVADFDAALAAANTALAVLANGSTATELASFQFDATNGYVFNDTDGNGTADQVVVLVGVNAIVDGDIIA